jgi:hypothetical protein
MRRNRMNNEMNIGTRPYALEREEGQAVWCLAGDGRQSSLLIGAREARVALARTQEDAAIEVEDVLSQADEALVMG